MFDIAWSELLLIAVVALIFIGPKELPQVLHSLGKWAAKMRRQADEFRRQFEDSMRESGYEDLNKSIQDLRSLNPSSQIRSSLERAINSDHFASTPSTFTGPQLAPPELPMSPDTNLLQRAAAVASGTANAPSTDAGAPKTEDAKDHAPTTA